MINAYLAREGFEDELLAELSSPTEQYGRLFVYEEESCRPSIWAANTWRDCRRASFTSISEAAKLLRGVQRNWTLYSYAEHRRAALVQQKLPHVSAKPLKPFSTLPDAPLGSFTLLDRQTLLYAGDCGSPVPHGEYAFVEDREGPPSRAYLKLWEGLTRLGQWPSAGERVLDAGSSPGGWTWVLAELGADVLSVDKAELASEVAVRSNVRFEQQSAFALDPQAVGKLDWFFSDVICYPDRLFKLIERFVAAKNVGRFFCTVKLQGTADASVLQPFLALPKARLMHLSHNRHELSLFVDTR